MNRSQLCRRVLDGNRSSVKDDRGRSVGWKRLAAEFCNDEVSFGTVRNFCTEETPASDDIEGLVLRKVSDIILAHENSDAPLRVGEYRLLGNVSELVESTGWGHSRQWK